jgi:hypothetical protein
MKLSNKILLDIVNNLILPDKDFQKALKLTKANSSGKIWLIGGFLYKNLAHSLYGSRKSTKDFDLIVEYPNDKIILPDDWKITKNHFNNNKLISNQMQIDFIPLTDLALPKNPYSYEKNPIPSINHFLESGGLNIHCIAYDIFDKKIIGDVGIKALEEKIISAYNLEMLEYGPKKYEKTPNDIIKKKAEELGFEYKLVD